MVVVVAVLVAHSLGQKARQILDMLAYNPLKAEALVEMVCPRPLEAVPYVATVRADQEDQIVVGLSHDLPFAVFGQGQENDEPEVASDEFVAAVAAAVELVAGAVGPVAVGPTDVAAEDGPSAERSIHSATLHQHP